MPKTYTVVVQDQALPRLKQQEFMFRKRMTWDHPDDSAPWVVGDEVTFVHKNNVIAKGTVLYSRGRITKLSRS